MAGRAASENMDLTGYKRKTVTQVQGPCEIEQNRRFV